MWNQIDKIERRVLITAGLVSAGHLFLIAYAAVFLHISVPTCQPNEKLFDKSELIKISDNRVEVHYIAKMWNFEPKKLVVPVGTTVDFFLASKDVNHGFHINNTNVNLMAVPGVINKGTHTFSKAGTYHIVCHEYCGLGHQNMNAEIEVSNQVQVASMDHEAVTKFDETNPIITQGRKVYQEKGCIGCHSVDGSTGAGPSFKGLWGKTEELADGSKVQVDNAYVSESIKEPAAKLVKGFGAIMPQLGLNDEEIKNITEYIKTLN